MLGLRQPAQGELPQSRHLVIELLGEPLGRLPRNHHPTSQVMTDDRWLSVDEIAAYLGVKRDTIYKWIERKGMPANKVGRLWKFKLDEVDSWVRSGNNNESRTQND